MSVDYDAIIVGAGMSGLSAGIRLAHFGKRVCILEKHSLWGGLNSFYKKGGRNFDVGLHAMTNFRPTGKPGPLQKICRQLRIDFDELKLHPQRESQIRFPSASLKFSNTLELLETEIARTFPNEIDGFKKLCQKVKTYDDSTLTPASVRARTVLKSCLGSPLLIDMLLSPLLFYGSATPQDMPWHQFVIMFKSIYLEGFCRPEGGVRHLLGILKREFLSRGGELCLNSPVREIRSDPGRKVFVVLESGQTVYGRNIFSSAGRVETERMIQPSNLGLKQTGQMSFVETIFCLKDSIQSMGWNTTILFYSFMDEFRYQRPDALVDYQSGIVCCPENFIEQTPFQEGVVRMTNIANYDLWSQLRSEDPSIYSKAKTNLVYKQIKAITTLGLELVGSIVFHDTFTPLTIEKFTSHSAGSVYGSPVKSLSGSTSLPNVFLCGTDQGYLGIVGSLLSGIIMANTHVLRSTI